MARKLIVVLTLVMAILVNVVTFASANNYGGYNGYSNGGYNRYTGVRPYASDTERNASNWFQNEFGEELEVTFYLYPNSSICRGDVFIPIGKAFLYNGGNNNDNYNNGYSYGYGVSFVDNTLDHSAQPAAGCLYSRGIMSGYPDNTVRFSNYITRAEFAKVAVTTAEAAGLISYGTVNYIFADMEDHWAKDYAAKAQAMGLVYGYGNGVFAPEQPITVEEYTAIVLRLAQRSNNNNYYNAFTTEGICYGISDTMDIDFGSVGYSKITEIEINANSMRMTVGDTEDLDYTISPRSASDEKVKFNSSNESVATIDSNGRIRARSEGSTTLKVYAAADADIKDSVKLTVVENGSGNYDILVSGISLSPSSVTLGVDQSKTITATIRPSNASNKDLEWSSDNESVAIVDQNGKITGKSAGNCTVTAEATDGSGIFATINVTINGSGNIPDPDPDPNPSDKVKPEIKMEWLTSSSIQVTTGEQAKIRVTASDDNLSEFTLQNSDILGLDGLELIKDIKRTSNNTYEITLGTTEMVGAFHFQIRGGVAIDVAGNSNDPSHEAVLVVIP